MICKRSFPVEDSSSSLLNSSSLLSLEKRERGGEGGQGRRGEGRAGEERRGKGRGGEGRGGEGRGGEERKGEGRKKRERGGEGKRGGREGEKRGGEGRGEIKELSLIELDTYIGASSVSDMELVLGF